jgi:hypothetical protein
MAVPPSCPGYQCGAAREPCEPAACIYCAAGGERDDGVRVGGGNGLNERVLAPGELEGAVVAFAFGA